METTVERPGEIPISTDDSLNSVSIESDVPPRSIGTQSRRHRSPALTRVVLESPSLSTPHSRSEHWVALESCPPLGEHHTTSAVEMGPGQCITPTVPNLVAHRGPSPHDTALGCWLLLRTTQLRPYSRTYRCYRRYQPHDPKNPVVHPSYIVLLDSNSSRFPSHLRN